MLKVLYGTTDEWRLPDVFKNNNKYY